MIKLVMGAGGALALATLARGVAPAPEIGAEVPEIQAVKWYNSPPLTMEDLRGQAVLVEVFRTW